MHPHRTASQNLVAASPQHLLVSPEKTTPVADDRPSSTVSDPMVSKTVPPGTIPTIVRRETPARGDTVKADGPARARTLRRRLISFAAGLATASGLLLTTSGVAHADGSLPDCVHGVLGTTSISTFLPLFSPSTAGMTENQWLYHWNGAWQYTGVFIGTHSYAGGVWMSGGKEVTGIDFSVRPGSGYYRVREQIVQANGSSFVFDQPFYRNVPGNNWTGWCQA